MQDVANSAQLLDRSVRHFFEVLDELNHIKVEFVSFRENIDTSGPLGRAMVVIVSTIAELERNLIIERVRAVARYNFRVARHPSGTRRPGLQHDSRMRIAS